MFIGYYKHSVAILYRFYSPIGPPAPPFSLGPFPGLICPMVFIFIDFPVPNLVPVPNNSVE